MLKATDVFTPGTFPVYTYVERTQQAREKALSDALSTPGQVVSLSGPSKSGKTVLIEKVVGRDNLIAISGVSIEKADDVWTKVLQWMNTPDSVTATEAHTVTLAAEMNAKAGLSFPLFAKAEAGIGGKAEDALASTIAAVRSRRGLPQVVAEIANSDYVVLIDDFHYMPREIQSEVAKGLKEAVRLNIKIATAVVPHREDDILRANPELRGRVHGIDLHYWNVRELAEIAQVGFSALNAVLSQAAVDKFAIEAAGSPQLMQSLCLQTCFVMNLRQQHDGMFPQVLDPNDATMTQIFEQTSSATNFRSLVDVLDDGPRTRGTERKTYEFNGGGSGDVYTVVLKAVSQDPPQLSFTYAELSERVAAVCNGEPPIGSSVVSTCSQMAKISLEKMPKERTIDWDESKMVFDLPDPYLMFYLRWSGRLTQPTP